MPYGTKQNEYLPIGKQPNSAFILHVSGFAFLNEPQI
jgi:hypothetical protein